MSKWDIFLADVPYEDLPESKIRPVVILDDSVAVIDCLKMTGQKPRLGEYVLKDWKGAGLRKQTTVRVYKRLALPQEKLIKKIGTLQIVDIAEIQKLI